MHGHINVKIKEVLYHTGATGGGLWGSDSSATILLINTKQRKALEEQEE
jgi:hypothetical protein